MVDVTIKEVPIGAEEKVKEMALIAIERFKREKELTISIEKQKTFETSVDLIRKANKLTQKYNTTEPIIKKA